MVTNWTAAHDFAPRNSVAEFSRQIREQNANRGKDLPLKTSVGQEGYVPFSRFWACGCVAEIF